MKLSIVIPYRQRLSTLRVVLASLAEQTMDRSQFEVVVGAMEYAQEYLSLCRELADRVSIVSVLLDADWNCSQARNLALRQASGQVAVILDADMALPPRCLQSLYERYYAAGQNVCVLGQSIGYNGRDGVATDLLPYDHYRDVLAQLDAAPQTRYDRRWAFEPVLLPWTIVWTGLVAAPLATIRQHGLHFDEGFRGWGGEDQEWGFRIAATGTPIVRGDDVWGVHLPHPRNVPANFAAFDRNRRYFLAKWPVLEVELYRAFDGWEANRIYPEVQREVAQAVAEPGLALGVARGSVHGADLLVVGATIDEQLRLADPELGPLVGNGFPAEVLPLVGLSLPFPDQSVQECRVLAPILRLSEGYRDLVLREAARVSRRVVTPALSRSVGR